MLAGMHKNGTTSVHSFAFWWIPSGGVAAGVVLLISAPCLAPMPTATLGCMHPPNTNP